MFTSIPLHIAFQIVQERAENDEEWKANTNFSVPTLIILLKLCLENTPFMWKEEYYMMIYGTSMGNILSMFIAGIIMEYIDNKVNNAVISKTLPPNKMWKREVDDILTIVNKNDIPQYLDFMNAQFEGMTFSHELPQQITKHNKTTISIPFIGVKIEWDSVEKRCIVSVYRHNVWTAVYLNYFSYSPTSHKRGCINTLLSRAHDIIKDPKILKKEILFIIEIFRYNNYPLWFIRSCIKRYQLKHNKPKPEPLKPIDINTKMEDIRKIKKENIGIFDMVKLTGKGRTLQVIIKEMNDIITNNNGNNDDDNKPALILPFIEPIEKVKIIAKESNWMLRRIKENLHIRKDGLSYNAAMGDSKLTFSY